MHALCAAAGGLGRLGTKAFMFHEQGTDPAAENALKEVARLTGGAYSRFDATSPETLASLLRSAATYAAGGLGGLDRLAANEPEARKLLRAMSAKR